MGLQSPFCSLLSRNACAACVAAHLSEPYTLDTVQWPRRRIRTAPRASPRRQPRPTAAAAGGGRPPRRSRRPRRRPSEAPLLQPPQVRVHPPPHALPPAGWSTSGHGPPAASPSNTVVVCWASRVRGSVVVREAKPHVLPQHHGRGEVPWPRTGGGYGAPPHGGFASGGFQPQQQQPPPQKPPQPAGFQPAASAASFKPAVFTPHPPAAPGAAPLAWRPAPTTPAATWPTLHTAVTLLPDLSLVASASRLRRHLRLATHNREEGLASQREQHTLQSAAAC